MRDDAVLTEPAHLVLLVILEVALEPFDVAVAFEGEDVRREAVQEPAIVADDDGAAGGIFEAASSDCRVSTSRSLVGSSSESTLAPMSREVDAVAFAAGQEPMTSGTTTCYPRSVVLGAATPGGRELRNP